MCVVQVISHIITTPHGVTVLLSSVSMQRGWWEVNGDNIFFSLWGKKNQENLFSIIISDQQCHQLTNTLVWQSFLDWNHQSCPSCYSSKSQSRCLAQNAALLTKGLSISEDSPQLTGQVPLPEYSHRCILPLGQSRQVQPTSWGSCGGKWTRTRSGQIKKYVWQVLVVPSCSMQFTFCASGQPSL